MTLHICMGRTMGQAIADIIGYVKNSDKTDDGSLVMNWQCSSWIANTDFLLTKKQYIQKTDRVSSEDDVISFYFHQSFVFRRDHPGGNKPPGQ